MEYLLLCNHVQALISNRINGMKAASQLERSNQLKMGGVSPKRGEVYALTPVKSAVIYHYGGEEAVRITDRLLPELHAGELLIRAHAPGLDPNPRFVCPGCGQFGILGGIAFPTMKRDSQRDSWYCCTRCRYAFGWKGGAFEPHRGSHSSALARTSCS
jgi:hypothetical protein